jgi:hypothetical protein
MGHNKGVEMENSGHTRRLAVMAGTVSAVMLVAVGCASAHHLAASHAAADRAAADRATALAAAQAKKSLPCTVSVSKEHPADYTHVGVRVRTAPGGQITVVAHYRTVRHEVTARAYANGRHTFRYWISDATPGYLVNVDVRVSQAGRKGSCATWFTPRRKASAPAPAPAPSSSPAQAQAPAPAPAPAPTTSPTTPAAWCTATASVYYAPKDWNNVYVNSNQPYRSATASADGYSWSYETNSSGYAEIYLNGPAPGASITVTVGGATCTTSD